MPDYMKQLASIPPMKQAPKIIIQKNPSIQALPGLRSTIMDLLDKETEEIEQLLVRLAEALDAFPVLSKPALELTVGQFQEVKRLKAVLKGLDKCTTIGAYITTLKTILEKFNADTTGA